MKKLVSKALTLAAAAMMSGSAFAAISYSEDFEGFGAGPTELGDAGWLVFANVFTDYPGCSSFTYPYGPFPAPNGGPGFSSVVTGSTGQALNAYSDYANVDHGIPFCIEANVFQEVVFAAADAGDYVFSFDTEVPAPPDDVLGPGVNTYGFIKLLDPNNGFSLDLFLTVDTTTPGSKSIPVTLDATADGKILQWGFTNTAGNYEASGRWYDNISFAQEQIPTGPPGATDAVSVPTLETLGLLLMLLAIGGVGVFTLTRRS